jgi:hypothetical protein
MRAHSTPSGARRSFVVVMAAITVALAGCTAAQATPAPPATPTPPIICDDGPNAHTPMPADCVIPSDPGRAPTPLPTFPYGAVTPNSPGPTQPANLATLPPTVPFHGKTIYTPPTGTVSQLIDIGPDDTLYVLLERALPVPKPTPTVAFLVPDVQASVVALRPDGSVLPGWPSAGVPVSGFPTSYKVNGDGTVFVASGANPFGGDPKAQTQLIVTAIGSDGKVLSGWPYRAPAALKLYDPELLVPGPDGTVCFLGYKPGSDKQGGDAPMVAYLVGRDGKLLPGWPYSSPSQLWTPAVGPDGTVYVAEKSSNDTTASTGTYPYQVVAISADGTRKSGWTPWVRADEALTTILPTKDGRVYILLGGDSGQARLVVVDSTGKSLSERIESPYGQPNYKDAVLTTDGTLVLSTGDGSEPYPNLVNVHAPDGSQVTGWPQPIGGWGDIAVSPDGSVWVEWTVYGSSGGPDTSVVALFDKNGKLQSGYPMAADALRHFHTSYGLEVASDGTAYETAISALGYRIVAFGR